MLNINSIIKQNRIKNLNLKIQKILEERLNNYFDINVDMENNNIVCTFKGKNIQTQNVDIITVSSDDIKKYLKKQNIISDDINIKYVFSNIKKNSKYKYNLNIIGDETIYLKGNIYGINDLNIKADKININGNITANNIGLKAQKIEANDSHIECNENVSFVCLNNISIKDSSITSFNNDIFSLAQIISIFDTNLNASNNLILKSDNSIGVINRDKKSYLKSRNLDLNSHYLDIVGYNIKIKDGSLINAYQTRIINSDLNTNSGIINSYKLIFDTNEIVANKYLIINSKDCKELSYVTTPVLLYNNKTFNDVFGFFDKDSKIEYVKKL